MAYNALTKGQGKTAQSATGGIQTSYDDGKADEFVIPFVVEKDGKPVANGIQDRDSVIFFNFRPDRARRLPEPSAMMSLTGLQGRSAWIWCMCFTDYDE